MFNGLMTNVCVVCVKVNGSKWEVNVYVVGILCIIQRSHYLPIW